MMRLRTLPITLLALAFAPTVATADTGASPVIGGNDAPAGKWPDVVGVVFDYGEDGTAIECTGTLIAPNLVMTAGHCNDGSLTQVVIGAPAVSRSAEGETIDVVQRFEYPDSQNTRDIMVLKLARDSTRAPRVIAGGWARFDIVNGATAALVGFGAVDRDATEDADVLQEALSSITDADCTTSIGCSGPAQPRGELGAGGDGIDTCPGDSGGPLYLVTDYGTFLAGVTSRSYDDAQFFCSEGGIYVRPDAVVDWIEDTTGVTLPAPPGPGAAPLVVPVDGTGQTQVLANDPHDGTTHSFAIVTPPLHGTAEIGSDGTLVYHAANGYVGDDTIVVEATDTADPGRTATGVIAIEVTEEGGCGCQTGASGGAAAPLLLLAALALLRPRRRRR